MDAPLRRRTKAKEDQTPRRGKRLQRISKIEAHLIEERERERERGSQKC
jgi:hypothetical protein